MRFGKREFRPLADKVLPHLTARTGHAWERCGVQIGKGMVGAGSEKRFAAKFSSVDGSMCAEFAVYVLTQGKKVDYTGVLSIDGWSIHEEQRAIAPDPAALVAWAGSVFSSAAGPAM